MKQKIDFVITWVDGNDPLWVKQRNKYSNDVIDSARFREWDNLKYWFRGVENFTPWVNKIYFVTWGHCPEWLNLNHEKLVVVNHTDFIPSKFLPTFSSHTIELNLHRISGLSDNFVYFNDDTFIIDKMNETDFFKDSLPCDSAIFNLYAPEDYNSVTFAANNDIAVINKNFNKKEVLKKYFFKFFNFKYGIKMLRGFLLLPWSRFTGFVEFHLPNSFSKSTFNTVWEKEPEVLELTCNDKFRNNKTNVNQWVFRQWQLVTGKFMPRNPNIGMYYDLGENFNNAIEAIKNRKYKMVCLNDTSTVTDFESKKNILKDVFEDFLNEKSSFEK